MKAEVKLFVGCRQERSYVRSLYTTPPFRIVSVGQLSRDNAAYLMQMSTSPGVLSGDSYTFRIVLDEGARLQLKSQSYQRLYDMDIPAHQKIDVVLGRDAVFSQVSHPIVPHKGSKYSSSVRVEMGECSSFLQSEIITCGRKYYGEEFLFDSFSNSVEIYEGERLRVRDRVWLDPKQTPLMQCGLLEGYTHQASLIYQTNDLKVDVAQFIEHIYSLLADTQNIHFGISATHYSGFILRALAKGGESLYNKFIEIQSYIWEEEQKLKKQ